VPDDFYATVSTIGVGIEAFGVEDAAVLATLPRHHRDPFDPMLVAQAISGGSALVSADPKLAVYDVAVVW
jgi:PIN domain nuclease of toxin-antitoxin system